MNISSRTPEGTPNRCPVCGKNVCIEPSTLFGDAPCPHCGSLLWFLRLSFEMRFYEHEEAKSIRERVIEELAAYFEVDAENVRLDPRLTFLQEEKGMDSLDVMERLMELEEELD